jgi:hypothetical protein
LPNFTLLVRGFAVGEAFYVLLTELEAIENGLKRSIIPIRDVSKRPEGAGLA